MYNVGSRRNRLHETFIKNGIVNIIYLNTVSFQVILIVVLRFTKIDHCAAVRRATCEMKQDESVCTAAASAARIIERPIENNRKSTLNNEHKVGNS